MTTHTTRRALYAHTPRTLSPGPMLAPRDFVARSLFDLGTLFIAILPPPGVFAAPVTATQYRTLETGLVRGFLRQTPKHDRTWVLRWLRGGARFARKRLEDRKREREGVGA